MTLEYVLKRTWKEIEQQIICKMGKVAKIRNFLGGGFCKLPLLQRNARRFNAVHVLFKTRMIVSQYF